MIIDSGIATGSLQVSGSFSTTGSSNLQGDVRITGSLSVSGPITGAITGSITNAVSASRATSAANADTASFVTLAQTASYVLNAVSASFATTAINAPFYVLTSSFATTSGSLSTRVTNLESTASTLTTASASFSTRVTNTESTASRLNTASASFALVSASYSTASGSLSTRTTNLESTSSTLTTASASFSTRVTNTEATSSTLTTASASFSTRVTNTEATSSTLTTASASISLRVTTLEGADATTGSNTFTGIQYVSNTTNATSFGSTAAIYTDGGLRVTKDTFISGGLSIAGNLTVFGTSSVNFITSSTLVGLEFINLNTDLPALRYAGINVGDSGSSAGISSSFWYDSAKDNWLYVYAPAGSGQVTSSMALSGPIIYNNVGNEQGLTANFLTKAQSVTADNNHHITSSQIFDDGTTVRIPGSLQVTGSLFAGNLTGSLNGSNLVNASVANAKLTNSTISGIALGSNLATLTIGTGLSGTSYNGSGAVTIANTGVTSFNTRTGAVTLAAADISGLGAGIFSGSAQIPSASITNTQLANNSVTVTAGTGMSGGGSVALGSSVTLTNAGVTSNVAGTGISVSGATGAVTITNTGVTSNVAGTGVTVSGATGAVTVSIGQAVATSSNVQFNSLGVGTAGSAVAGEIRATADITAFYSSDERLKEAITPIENPIEKLMTIDGVTFNWKEGFEEIHSHIGADTGIIAQQVKALELPGVTTTRETGYMAVNYEKLNALLIEGFKAQQREINELKVLVNTLLNK